MRQKHRMEGARLLFVHEQRDYLKKTLKFNTMRWLNEPGLGCRWNTFLGLETRLNFANYKEKITNLFTKTTTIVYFRRFRIKTSLSGDRPPMLSII
jgi:hypothetical protein